jgi:surface protein
MYQMFCQSSKLTTIPQLDTHNVTDMSSMFTYCSSLTTIPQIDTSKVTSMYQMFGNCTKLESVPPLYAGNLTYSMTYYGIFGSSEMTALTDFGGLIDLKYRMNGNYSFQKCPNLTYQSCINILNGLYDFTGNGETPTSNQGALKVHKNFLDLVGDKISIGINKGWTITT